ncbi:MAG: MFS transporter, partial [Simkaniaceae bacterium]|nr:MFS transporter [Simkaniaceae bacterium]
MSRSIFNRSFYKWVVWGFGALFMFYKFAIEVSPSVMTTHLMAAFEIDGAYLGNLAASYFYGYLAMQLPAGILVDRFGPRRVTTIAILFCSVGGLVFALSPQLWVASMGRLLMGLGAAFAAINCLKLTANWFPLKRFAFMAGLMMSIAMLGAVGGQAPLFKMIQALGWREAMLIISYSGFGLGLLFFILIRNRAPKHRKVDIASEKMGIWNNCLAIFKSKQAWLLSIYSGLAFAPVTFFGGLWGVPFIMQKYALSQTLSAQAISMIFIGFGVGAPVAG